MKLEEMIREAVMEAMEDEVENLRKYVRDAVKYAVYAEMASIDLEEMVCDMVKDLVSETEVRGAVEELAAAIIDEMI